MIYSSTLYLNKSNINQSFSDKSVLDYSRYLFIEKSTPNKA